MIYKVIFIFQFALILIVACGTVVLVACGPLPTGTANSATYSYQFNVNNCDTGYKAFNDRISLCNSLKDDAANYYCAYNERYSKFLQDCSDQTWP